MIKQKIKKIKSVKTNEDCICKVQKCCWCEREKMMTYKFISEYFSGWYCKECCELAFDANQAAKNDRS